MFKTNPIHINQGASWFLNLTLLDDDVYKSKIVDFILRLEVDYDLKSTLLIMAGYDISKADFKIICQNLVVKYLSNSELADFEKIFITPQVANLEGCEVNLYVKVFKSSTSTKTFNLKVTGVKQGSGTVHFEMTPEQTYEFISQKNKEFDLVQEGTYTIEVKEIAQNKIDKVLEGDVLVYRTSK